MLHLRSICVFWIYEIDVLFSPCRIHWKTMKPMQCLPLITIAIKNGLSRTFLQCFFFSLLNRWDPPWSSVCLCVCSWLITRVHNGVWRVESVQAMVDGKPRSRSNLHGAEDRNAEWYVSPCNTIIGLSKLNTDLPLFVSLKTFNFFQFFRTTEPIFYWLGTNHQ
jgi:hypothetical protein